MKQSWDWDELADTFTLTASETAFLTGSPHNRLGLAILLKTYQHLGRFPSAKDDIPFIVVEYIANQLNCSVSEFDQYDWHRGRVRNHRQAIRQLLGFRQITQADKQKLQSWIQTEVLPHEHRLEQLRQQARDYLHKRSIEQTTDKQLNRLLKAAIRQHETRFFEQIHAKLTNEMRTALNDLVERSDLAERNERIEVETGQTGLQTVSGITLRHLKSHPGKASVKNFKRAADKLRSLQALGLPTELLAAYPRRFLQQYRQMVAVESPSQLLRRRQRNRVQYDVMLAIFCWLHQQMLTDDMVDLFIDCLRDIKVSAESRVERELVAEFKRVRGKDSLLARLAEKMLENPDATIREAVFPIADEEKLREIIAEFKADKTRYRKPVRIKMHRSYGHHYRQLLPVLLDVLSFRSNNKHHQPLIDGLALVQEYLNESHPLYPAEEDVPLDDVIPVSWRGWVLEKDGKGRQRVRRLRYELVVLQRLRDYLRCKEIWVVGANRFRNPDDDLPADFSAKSADYITALGWPLEADAFIEQLKADMRRSLKQLNDGMATNDAVEILERDNGHIKIAPLKAQASPPNWKRIKQEVKRRWHMTTLLDIVKEVDLQVDFASCFNSLAASERLSRAEIQLRLLLCLFGLGTNTGIAAVSMGKHGMSVNDLAYIRRRFVHRDALRQAIAKVTNAIFDVRQTVYWGEGSTAVAGDSKQFAAWSQNMRSQWHRRYRKTGVMVYWSVENNATCIYSSVKAPASSEVAAMIKGILNHCTTMRVERSYVDTHGQSHVGFAFCHLLGFDLMPRLANIQRQKLYLPDDCADDYAELEHILNGTIDWEAIRTQYLQLMNYTTAMRLGLAEPEAILQRFRRENAKHPTYKALQELGKAVKTIFLCRYLHAEELRREINSALNVIETWNGVNDFILYGNSGEIPKNDLDGQEIVALSLHLLQNCLIYINTLMVQEVLSEPRWHAKMTAADWRAMTPLFHKHVNPYGIFELDMTQRIPLQQAVAA